MKQISIVHEFACTEDRFWRIFFDPEYLAEVYRDALKVADLKVVELKETEAEIRRTLTGRPQLKLPAAAQKLVGDRVSFTEEGRFDRSAKVWRFSFTTSTFGDKVKSSGTIRIEPTAKGVRRVAEITVEAKIFGVSGMIEGQMETSMRESYGAGAAFLTAWLARHPE